MYGDVDHWTILLSWDSSIPHTDTVPFVTPWFRLGSNPNAFVWITHTHLNTRLYNPTLYTLIIPSLEGEIVIPWRRNRYPLKARSSSLEGDIKVIESWLEIKKSRTGFGVPTVRETSIVGWYDGNMISGLVPGSLDTLTSGPTPPHRPRRRHASFTRAVLSEFNIHRLLAILVAFLAFSQTVMAQIIIGTSSSSSLSSLSSLLGFTVSNANTPLNMFCTCNSGLLGGLLSLGGSGCTSDLSCLVQETCEILGYTASQVVELQLPAGLMTLETDMTDVIEILLGQCTFQPAPTTTSSSNGAGSLQTTTVVNKYGVTYTVTETAVYTTTTFITQPVTTTTTTVIKNAGHRRALATTSTKKTTITSTTSAPVYTTTTTTMVAVVTAYRNNAVVVTASSTVTPTSTPTSTSSSTPTSTSSSKTTSSTTSTTSTTQPAASGVKRRKLEEETERQHRLAGFLCPVGKTACRVSSGEDDYECVDTLNELSQSYRSPALSHFSRVE